MQKKYFFLVFKHQAISRAETSYNSRHEKNVPDAYLNAPLLTGVCSDKESSACFGCVDAHGVLIYYKILGRGAPLVIVHGGPGASHDYLLPYLLPLARTNRLVFIDERGSGRSQKLEDASKYTVENMVEDVEDVRQALGLGKIS